MAAMTLSISFEQPGPPATHCLFYKLANTGVTLLGLVVSLGLHTRHGGVRRERRKKHVLLLILERKKVYAVPMWGERGDTVGRDQAHNRPGCVGLQPDSGCFCLKRISFQSSNSPLKPRNGPVH